jgi:protein-S-isoprenylcysteine O-methyltransferase Ste14
MREIVGNPPVHPVLLVMAKACIAFPFIILVLRLAGVDLLGVTTPPARWPVAAVLVAGVTLIVVALVQLGEAARVGLPSDDTALRTKGVYGFSRNPIYFAAALIMVASCTYVPHWLNIASTAAAIVIHHRIVLSEERFLAQRFGAAWEDYKKRVRRY